jgi:hypothetical protein
MFRSVPAIAAAAAALFSTSAVLAADYGDGALRGSLPSNWGDLNDAGDPLEFEFGVRYSYTKGNRSMVENGNAYQIDDTAHTLELYGRIDDFSTGTFLKGYAGYSAIFEGTDTTPLTAGATAVDSGHLASANVDFGYLGFGDGGFTWGPFVGYQYSGTESAIGAVAETVAIDMHIMRLGLAARADIGESVDIAADLALVPYSVQSGTAGNGDSFDATLFGVQSEITLGFHPYDNVVVSVGARGSYLTDNFGAAGTDHSTEFRAGGILGVGYSF